MLSSNASSVVILPAPAPWDEPERPIVIEIEYIVKDRNGVERLRTTDKKAADAYDKALDNADRLAKMLREDQVLPALADSDLEELTVYMARNARNVERILRGKEPEPTPPADESSNAGTNVAPLKAAG
jgi:dsDNA-binding SOS-regulon protein